MCLNLTLVSTWLSVSNVDGLVGRVIVWTPMRTACSMLMSARETGLNIPTCNTVNLIWSLYSLSNIKWLVFANLCRTLKAERGIVGGSGREYNLSTQIWIVSPHHVNHTFVPICKAKGIAFSSLEGLILRLLLKNICTVVNSHYQLRWKNQIFVYYYPLHTSGDVCCSIRNVK